MIFALLGWVFACDRCPIPNHLIEHAERKNHARASLNCNPLDASVFNDVLRIGSNIYPNSRVKIICVRQILPVPSPNLLHIGEVTAVDMLRFVCGNGFQGNHPFRHSPPIFQEILDQRHIDGFAICAWLHAVINDDLNLPGLVVQKGWKKPIDDPRHCVFAQPTTKPFQISHKLVLIVHISSPSFCSAGSHPSESPF